MRDFEVIVQKDEIGGYVAMVPALPGCHTQGDTMPEVLENIKEAIDLYIETLTLQEKEELLKVKVFNTQRVKDLA
jgi:predicted RNase H-like HicB family nuclease